ncbi:Signal transduction histidine kinase [Dyella jiangningensis]|uniref:sensor histidine kinase n=1 Tax=Dyella sp. AtDHG13 TaxID=1938897 RepID=UPI00087FB78F|nr:HAMP domain-containing sensor histidine kinase [Dyella sp. AtDHG13]PXV61596.1 signal transduction histidine kinase [Dyella sp. AtDHG13]SDJ70200.1 Signal transduction histidine kinase [Dyella jiangningensis]
MPLSDFRHSVVFRMAAGYGLLLLLSVALIAAVFYVGTAGLLKSNIDEQLRSHTRQLVQEEQQRGMDALTGDIHDLLTDNQDSDTEIYLLLDAHGRKTIGNLTAWPASAVAGDGMHELEVSRLDRHAASRLLSHRFADGSVLLVGRDMQDVRTLEHRIVVAFGVGGMLALLLAGGGALLFRTQLQRQLKAIHRTTTEVAAGRLDRRIAVGRSRDEFAIVARDVNDMLDEIERLMDSTRQVSNAIAHDLRTPLGRVRAALEQALRSPQRDARLPRDAQYAIDEIDGLITVLDKMLQIAEAESGVRRGHFEALPLDALLGDLAELYQPAAELRSISLQWMVEGAACVMADRHLLAGVLANLLDNAFKYAGEGALVVMKAQPMGEWVHISVQDDGPGMPDAALARATERFFRVDSSRHQRGNGLGLSIVAAVVSLHRGRLTLENTHPGLRVAIDLPGANLSKS